MSIKFEFLPNPGEAILITIDNQFTILMDGGYGHPFKKEFLKTRNPPALIDMVIVTHIDKDHIGGIVKIFKDKNYFNNVKHLLFNEPEICDLFSEANDSNEVSDQDGNSLLNLLQDNKNINYIKSIYHSNIEIEEKISNILPNTKVKILSPSKLALEELLLVWDPCKYRKKTDVSDDVIEIPLGDVSTLAQQQYSLDTNIPNKSSIALLLSHNNKNYLLLGDSHITQINQSLIDMGFSKENPLHIEFVKMSHHGSIRNINKDFFALIKTNQYIICNTSVKAKKHPNKETIAQIAFYGLPINNSETKKIMITKKSNVDIKFDESDHKKFNFEIIKQKDTLEF